MNNGNLVKFLKDVRAGNVQSVDSEILSAYGLTDIDLQMPQHVLLERLISEFEASEALRAQLAELEEQAREAKHALDGKLLEAEGQIMQLAAGDALTSKLSARWSCFVIGWLVCSLVLLSLFVIGSDAGQFTFGWICAMLALPVGSRLAKVLGFINKANSAFKQQLQVQPAA